LISLDRFLPGMTHTYPAANQLRCSPLLFSPRRPSRSLRPRSAPSQGRTLTTHSGSPSDSALAVVQCEDAHFARHTLLTRKREAERIAERDAITDSPIRQQTISNQYEIAKAAGRSTLAAMLAEANRRASWDKLAEVDVALGRRPSPPRKLRKPFQGRFAWHAKHASASLLDERMQSKRDDEIQDQNAAEKQAVLQIQAWERIEAATQARLSADSMAACCIQQQWRLWRQGRRRGALSIPPVCMKQSRKPACRVNQRVVEAAPEQTGCFMTSVPLLGTSDCSATLAACEVSPVHPNLDGSHFGESRSQLCAGESLLDDAGEVLWMWGDVSKVNGRWSEKKSFTEVIRDLEEMRIEFPGRLVRMLISMPGLETQEQLACIDAAIVELRLRSQNKGCTSQIAQQRLGVHHRVSAPCRFETHRGGRRQPRPGKPGPVRKAQWMWGDVSTLNPFQWSERRSVKETIMDLEQWRFEFPGRPVRVSISAQGCDVQELLAPIDAVIVDLRLRWRVAAQARAPRRQCVEKTEVVSSNTSPFRSLESTSVSVSTEKTAVTEKVPSPPASQFPLPEKVAAGSALDLLMRQRRTEQRLMGAYASGGDFLSQRPLRAA